MIPFTALLRARFVTDNYQSSLTTNMELGAGLDVTEFGAVIALIVTGDVMNRQLVYAVLRRHFVLVASANQHVALVPRGLEVGLRDLSLEVGGARDLLDRLVLQRKQEVDGLNCATTNITVFNSIYIVSLAERGMRASSHNLNLNFSLNVVATAFWINIILFMQSLNEAH